MSGNLFHSSATRSAKKNFRASSLTHPLKMTSLLVFFPSSVIATVVVVVVVGAVSPEGPVNPGVRWTPRNTGATPSGASTELKGGAETSQKAADEGLP